MPSLRQPSFDSGGEEKRQKEKCVCQFQCGHFDGVQHFHEKGQEICSLKVFLPQMQSSNGQFQEERKPRNIN